MNKLDKKICDKVLSSFAGALKINSSDINIERNFSEFSNLDSLGFVKLIISLNEKFNIEPTVSLGLSYKTDIASEDQDRVKLGRELLFS